MAITKKRFSPPNWAKKNRTFLTAHGLAGISSDLMRSHWTKALLARRTKMSRKAATTLAVLLVFGTASAVLADADNRTDHQGSFGQRPMSMMSDGRSGASQLAVVRGTPFCRDGIAGRSRAWIKLTEPGGKSIHINVEHVTSVRSDTQIPGARAQLDLTSGKFQGVQENVEQVMQLISAAPGAYENNEPSAVL
jgi:hypothetical protein